MRISCPACGTTGRSASLGVDAEYITCDQDGCDGCQWRHLRALPGGHWVQLDCGCTLTGDSFRLVAAQLSAHRRRPIIRLLGVLRFHHARCRSEARRLWCRLLRRRCTGYVHFH